jgi:cation diffusion facilitator family transporter
MMALVGAGALGIHLFYFNEANEGEVIDPSVWMIPFIAVIMLEVCYQIIIRAAKQQNSPALAADALHYRMDGLTSLFATVALLLGAYIPELSVILDNVGAILIALLMIGIGLHVARQNLDQLLDHVPEEKYFERVRNAAKRTKGVLGTEKIRIQLYGPDAQVDIDVEVDPQHTVAVAHEISQKVRAEIQKDWPAVLDVVVHIEPFYPNDH